MNPICSVVNRALTIVVFCFMCSNLQANAERRWPLPEGIKSVEVNGYDMAYQEAGAGPHIVLVHGALTDYRIWNTLVPAFAKRFHVIAVSLRHYYPEKWDGTGNDFSFEQHADDVVALIKKLNLGQVHLLGHSRGGGVVVTAAKTHPEVIKTLILADAVGFEAMLPNTPESQKTAQMTQDRIDTLRKNLASGNIELAAQVFVDSLNAPGAWATRTPAQRQRLFDNLSTAAQMAVAPATSCEQVAKFNFPILILHGENSPKNFYAMSAAMRDCKPIAEPIVVPNAAHNMFIDNAPVFNAAVFGFLSHD
jgi:esterase